MFETRANRVLQIFYPTLVFLALFLSWNTVGQARGLGDGSITAFDLKPPRVTQVSAPSTCTNENSDAALGGACKSDENTSWTLLDRTQEDMGASKTTGASNLDQSHGYQENGNTL